MPLDRALQFVPAFVLVFFRLAGMMVAAPLFGSARIPRRLKLMFALVLALGVMPGIPSPPPLPSTTWQLAAAIAGELLFGLAVGTALSFVFVAASWAGEIIGQQMGLGIGQVYDPQFGQGGSVVGDLYFLLTLVIFLIVRGHHAFLRGAFATFHSLPLLSVGITHGLLDLVVALLQSATMLAIQLAAPTLLTMLITELLLGFISKTVPQINVLTAGLSLRSVLGILVLIFSATLASSVIRDCMLDSMREIGRAFIAPLTSSAASFVDRLALVPVDQPGKL